MFNGLLRFEYVQVNGLVLFWAKEHYRPEDVSQVVGEYCKYSRGLVICRLMPVVTALCAVLLLFWGFSPIGPPNTTVWRIVWMATVLFGIGCACLYVYGSRLKRDHVIGKDISRDMQQLQDLFRVNLYEMSVEEIQGIVVAQLQKRYENLKALEGRKGDLTRQAVFQNARRAAVPFFGSSVLVGKEVDIPLQLAS